MQVNRMSKRYKMATTSQKARTAEGDNSSLIQATYDAKLKGLIGQFGISVKESDDFYTPSSGSYSYDADSRPGMQLVSPAEDHLHKARTEGEDEENKMGDHHDGCLYLHNLVWDCLSPGWWVLKRKDWNWRHANGDRQHYCVSIHGNGTSSDSVRTALDEAGLRKIVTQLVYDYVDHARSVLRQKEAAVKSIARLSSEWSLKEINKIQDFSSFVATLDREGETWSFKMGALSYFNHRHHLRPGVTSDPDVVGSNLPLKDLKSIYAVLKNNKKPDTKTIRYAKMNATYRRDLTILSSPIPDVPDVDSVDKRWRAARSYISDLTESELWQNKDKQNISKKDSSIISLRLGGKMAKVALALR